MKRVIVFVILALLLTSVAFSVAGAVAKKQTAAKAPAIDPKASQLMKQMSDYLTGLDQFSVHVNTINEVVLSSGQRLDMDRMANVYVERPDNLRVDVVSATRNRQIYYNGKTFTIYSPDRKFYGSWNAPPTIQQTVDTARQNYGLALPGADLLSSNPYQRMMKNVTSGSYVGQTLLEGGVLAHHLAFRQKDIDWQIWIQSGDKPLPRRIIITDKSVGGQPQHYAILSNWNTNPNFQAGLFDFVPPAGAQRIRVATVPRQPRPAGGGISAGAGTSTGAGIGAGSWKGK